MDPIKFAIMTALTLYTYICMIWVFGSWFPQWQYQQWFKMVASIVEPFINVFKPLNLRFGMFDLTPMVAIFVVIIFRELIRSI